MKVITLLLYLSFLLIGISVRSQEIDVKYRRVIDYLKSQKTDTLWNVSPIIRCLPIIDYITDLEGDTSSSCRMIVDSFITNGKMRTLRFKPYRDTGIVHLSDNSKVTVRYIVFSRPVDNFLCVEIRNGNMNLTGMSTPYFGRAKGYLFIFSSDNKIVKVFTTATIYN
jgi:hypothetical protein